MTDPAELFEAISHPTRIRILRVLDKEPASFSALKRQLKIDSSGNIDHHVKKLGQLVNVGADGLYVLTDAGKEALRAIDAINAWKRIEEQKVKAFADAPRELKILVALETVLSLAAVISAIGLASFWSISSPVSFKTICILAAFLGFLAIYGFIRGSRWTWTLVIVKSSLVMLDAIVLLYFTARLWQTGTAPWQVSGLLLSGIMVAVFVIAETGVLFLASRKRVRESLGSDFGTPLPRRALIGGLLGLAGGISGMMVGTSLLFSSGPYGAGPLGVLNFIWSLSGLTIAIGGVLILLRRYTLGGLIVIIFNLFPSTNLMTTQYLLLHFFPKLSDNTVTIWLTSFASFTIFILFITGGVLALISRPKP